MYRCIIFSALILPKSMVNLANEKDFKQGEGATPEESIDTCVRMFFPHGTERIRMLEDLSQKPTWQPLSGVVYYLGDPIGTVSHIESSITSRDPDSTYTMSDWRYEVSNRDTVLGYAEWVEHKREANT